MNNKTENTEKFYDKLISEKNNKTFFSFEARFEQNKILQKENIKIYFDNIIKNFISQNDVILDYGCGSGAFTYKISHFTNNKVIGVDISEEFIKNSKKFFNDRQENLEFEKIDGIKSKFNDSQFDKILMVDVIHHLENIDIIFKELKRMLKKDGRILVYEPNLLNPLIFITHLIEKNERGLLRVGLKKRYVEICRRHEMEIEYFSFNGIIIGPDSILFETISKTLNHNFFNKFLGWLNPKIFFVIKKI